MFTEKQFLRSISGKELDDYLEKGWYRLGQLVFTCYLILFQDKLYTPIWVRLPLGRYMFRKSVRKIMNKVESSFSVKVGEGKITDQKEQLYQVYRRNFKGEIAPSLIGSLQDLLPSNIFNSKCIEVFHGKKLIAFSFFDLGELSLASIKGVYDPAYSRYSLGLYTMLKEIEFGKDNGFDFYYPGYVVPGYDRFDYKLRIGTPEEVEFFDPKINSWKTYDKISEANNLSKHISGKLMRIAWSLSGKNISSQLLYYQVFDPQNAYLKENQLLTSPLFLNVFNNYFSEPKFILFFDFKTDEYVFLHSLKSCDLENSDLLTTSIDKEEAGFILRNGNLIYKTSSELEILDCVKSINKIFDA